MPVFAYRQELVLFDSSDLSSPKAHAFSFHCLQHSLDMLNTKSTWNKKTSHPLTPNRDLKTMWELGRVLPRNTFPHPPSKIKHASIMLQPGNGCRTGVIAWDVLRLRVCCMIMRERESSASSWWGAHGYTTLSKLDSWRRWEHQERYMSGHDIRLKGTVKTPVHLSFIGYYVSWRMYVIDSSKARVHHSHD